MTTTGRKRTNHLPTDIVLVMRELGVSEFPRLAEAMGVTYDRTSNWAKRGGMSDDGLKLAAKLTGKPEKWFTDEANLVHPSRLIAQEQPAHDRYRTPQRADEVKATLHVSCRDPLTFDWGADQHWQVVPRYEHHEQSEGSDVPEVNAGELAFEVGFMRKAFGRSGGGFASIEVRGDSMQPTLLDGDQIIVDCTARRVDVSGIYVIDTAGAVDVKRVQLMLDGSLVVKCDNAAYSPQTVSRDQAEQLPVIGRMVWPRVR